MTYPAFNFILDGYSCSVTPSNVRTVFSSNNTRQRKRVESRNDTFSVRHILTTSEFLSFENYVNDTLNGGELTDSMPYYVSDYELTGTGRIIDGEYTARKFTNDLFDVSFTMQIEGRDLTEEQNIYESINALGGFDSTKEWIDALEDMVNNNQL